MKGKEKFEEPKIIATYDKEELEEVIRPHLINNVIYGTIPTASIL